MIDTSEGDLDRQLLPNKLDHHRLRILCTYLSQLQVGIWCHLATYEPQYPNKIENYLTSRIILPPDRANVQKFRIIEEWNRKRIFFSRLRLRLTTSSNYTSLIVLIPNPVVKLFKKLSFFTCSLFSSPKAILSPNAITILSIQFNIFDHGFFSFCFSRV